MVRCKSMCTTVLDNFMLGPIQPILGADPEVADWSATSGVASLAWEDDPTKNNFHTKK